MRWVPEDCERGDMIRVRLGSIYHYGVFVSEDEVIAFGLPPVEKYRDDPRRLIVVATDIDVFSCEKIVERAVAETREEKKKKNKPDKAVGAARSRLGETGYDLLRNNCEHFATECVFGERRCSEEENARKKWLNRPICDVYVAAIDAENESARIAAIRPPERRSETEKTANAPLRAARLCDWELLAFAAKRSLGVDIADAKFKKKHGGKWTCDKFEFSLSHTKTHVAAAVSNHAVGVDMEFAEEIALRLGEDRLDALRRRYFTDGEKERYKGGAREFLECFTKKEAVFKREGKSVFSPSHIDTAKAPSSTVSLKNGATLSVCTESPECVRVYTVEDGKAKLAETE